MNLIDVFIPLVPGIILAAFPNMVTPKTATAEETAKKEDTLRKIGYVLIGVAALYFILILTEPSQTG